MTARSSRILSIGFLALLMGLVGAGYLVARAAQSAILESESGSISEFSLDPTAPGFRAFTESTPTALVLHTAVRAGSGAELVGATLLTAAGESAGGTVVTIPRTFTEPDGQNVPLSDLFTEQGLDAVVDELKLSMRIGFGDVVVLDASAWTSLMTADLPLTLTLRNDLVETSADGATNAIVLAADTRPFDLAEVARIAAHRNQGEPALTVALRQQHVWQSWISRTAGEQERPEFFELQSGFVALLGSLANAEVSYQTIPSTTAPGDTPEETRYVARSALIADLVASIVPFPEQAFPGDRPSVMLITTSLSEQERTSAVSAITRAGGLVTILGNGEMTDPGVTAVQQHDEQSGVVARSIADTFDAGEPLQVPVEDATASITVRIG